MEPMLNAAASSHPAAKPTRRKLTWASFSILAAVALGVGLRVYFFLLNRSLWFDEAMLALNLVERDFSGLLQPLAYNQGAPLAFLLVQKTVISLLGNRDYLLRLFPLLCGLTSIPVFYLVARQHLKSPAMHLSLWLFALSPRLIYYSSECKQYASDVLAALGLLYLAGVYLIGQQRKRSLLLTGLVGALTLWFSHPALFVLGGVFLAIGLDCLTRRDDKLLICWLALGLLNAANLGLNYLVSLHHLAANALIRQHWQASFAPLPPWQDWGWYGQVWLKFLEDPLKLPANLLTLLLVAAGGYALTQRSWRAGLALMAPLLLTLAASALQKYPFGERMLLFLAPTVLLLLAAGIDFLREATQRWKPQPAWLVFLALSAYMLGAYTVENLRNLPPAAQSEHIKPLLGHIRAQAQPQDHIYVYYGSGPAFLYYAPQIGFDKQSYLVGSYNRENPEAYLQELEPFARERRVWLLFSHNCSWCQVDEEAYILNFVGQIGPQKEALLRTNASLYLYDLR